MKLKGTLKELGNLENQEKAIFFEYISEAVPIGIRILLDRQDLDDKEKLHSLMLINEFHHEMNKLKRMVRLNNDFQLDIEVLGEYIVQFSNKGEYHMISDEIGYCLKNATEKLFLKRKNQ